MRDEYAIVLDYLKKGHTYQAKSHPVAQLVGEKYFSLLEVIPKEGVDLKPMERVYIGNKERDKVRSIIGRVKPEKLTATARNELEYAIEKIVKDNEDRFVKFINESGPITTKQHQLDLLPGIGKKHMWEIIEERKKKPFESFEDLKTRVPSIKNPLKSIVSRILKEIEEDVKWRLFVPEVKEKPAFKRRRFNYRKY